MAMVRILNFGQVVAGPGTGQNMVPIIVGGFSRGDVQELIANGCELVILTTGRFKRLMVPQPIVDFLREQSIEVIVADTKKGIHLYNDFAGKGVAAGGLFHSTC